MKFYNEKENDFVEKLISGIREKNYVDAGSLTVEASKDKTVSIDDFVTAMEQGYSVLIRFTAAKHDGLTATFDDFVVVCPIEEFSGRIKHSLGHQYEAIVYDVDMENRIVYISCAKAMQNIVTRRESEAQRLNRYIIEKLKKKQRVVLPARVVKIITKQNNKSAAILSICGTDVTGYISVVHWAPNYIRRFESVCEVGNWYDVEVISRRMSNTKSDTYWTCSRVNIAEDPWITNNFDEKFKKKDLLTVRCLSVDSSNTWWWGSCNDVKGIELFCDMKPYITITPGCSYKCSIKEINSKNRMFKVVPISQVVDEEDQVVFRRNQSK